MPFDPAFAGLTAKGITKLIETDIGDKCIHHATKLTTQKDRSKERDEGQDQTSDKSQSKQDHKREDDDEWSRKSYWRSGRHQQASSQPRLRPNEVLEDEWSRKTYWKRRRHQQQPTPSLDEMHVDPEKPMPKAARKEEQLREQRRDKFRDAKDSYVPASGCSANELSWDEDKLYADVGRAVREAGRRSGEESRGGHW